MIEIKVEFEDIIKLNISEGGRLELTLENTNYIKEMTSWLDAFQLDRLIMELKIIKESTAIKYPDERKNND